MISISPSTLGIYLNCKRCFWLHINGKVKRPRGPYPSLPGGMDSIIKVYFNKYRLMNKMPPIIAGRVEGKLAKIPLNLKFKDEGNDLTITGKLDDCIELDGNVYAPLDHKTRGSLPGGEEYSYKYYKRQMDAYTFLLGKSGYPTKNIAYIVYYSPASGELHNGIPFETEVHKVETDPEGAYRLFIEARKFLDGPMPAEPDATCEYCTWAAKAFNM